MRKVGLLLLSWPTLLLRHVFHYLVKCLWSKDICRVLTVSFFPDKGVPLRRHMLPCDFTHKTSRMPSCVSVALLWFATKHQHLCGSLLFSERASSRSIINPVFKTAPNKRAKPDPFPPQADAFLTSVKAATVGRQKLRLAPCVSKCSISENVDPQTKTVVADKKNTPGYKRPS